MPFLCKSAMLLLTVLNLLDPFSRINLSKLEFVVVIAVLVSSIMLMGKVFKKVTLLFLFGGVTLLLYSGQPFTIWVMATNSMMNVISILFVMQLFSIPIEIGGYNSAIHYWLLKVHKGEAGLFLFVTIVTHIISSFLSFGTIPVMISLLEKTLKRNVSNYERFISTAISRSYALVVLWAPGTINLLLVVQATGVGWIELFIPGLILSLIGIVTSYVIERKLNLSAKTTIVGDYISDCKLSDTPIRGKVYHIILVVLSLIAGTMIFANMNVGSSTNQIMLTGFIVVLTWTAFFVRRPNFKTALSAYWRDRLLKAVDLAPLFVSMGIFSTAVQQAGLFNFIQPALQVIANAMGLWSMVLVPILMILCAIAGIHPFVSIVLFGQILTTIQLPIAPVSVALCLALGGSISYIISPFAGIVLTLAKFINCRTFDIALRWNWLYSLLFFIEGIVFAYVWGHFR
ncbi:hypothetical protein SOV_44210 [Sporomusa ovata DSM 2662]|uniref:Uncharacterized protein n=1 Tax=Sporomusa ovata TaxID=2378 RepID=A0A0U1KUV6_9FIRM|nr:hypothetical protein SOV_3c06830 [Sporomusa ovata DSM 2662]CQR70909.1 hypothetical protein SpAn4DRAFT_1887 [Sporomusa ovata]